MKTPKVAVKHEMVEVECVAEEYALIENWCREQGRTFQVLVQGASTLDDGRMADCLYVQTAPTNHPERTRVEQFNFVVFPGLSWTREPQLPQRTIEAAAQRADWVRVRELCWYRIEKQSEDGFALNWLGQPNRLLGDPGGALRVFEQAWSRVPKGLAAAGQRRDQGWNDADADHPRA